MSDDSLQLDDMDFDAQMAQFSSANLPPAGQPSSRARALDKSDVLLVVCQAIRPLAQELEAITKRAAENNLLLVALGKNTASQTATVGATTHALDGMVQQLQRLGTVETANQKLFDALHTELKGYKDNFLFEALQKPFIRELLPFFDDLTGLSGQLEKRRETLRNRPASTEGGDEADFLKNLAGNVEVHLHHLVEILLRMDVVLTQTARGLPVDKKIHRILSFEPAPAPQDDNTVARSTKPGFLWKERMLRPEDIVAYRWREPAPAVPSA